MDDFTSGSSDIPTSEVSVFFYEAETIPDNFVRTSITQGATIIGTGVIMSLLVIGIMSILRKG